MEQIERIHTITQKQKAEHFQRHIWQSCFGDPKAYEDFYFETVYPKNIAYQIREKGMLHLNPYSCMIQGKERVIHYIVGVATAKSQRRKGIMRRLLQRALVDLYQEREAFTYLMPADIRYYQPFSFISIGEKQEKVLMPAKEMQIQKWEEEIQFVKYSELVKQWTSQKLGLLFQYVDRQLSKKYNVYAKHNKAYFDLLLNEKQCQEGEVVFCFRKGVQPENMAGVFAYGTDKEKIFVEQILLEEKEEEYLQEYCKKQKEAGICMEQISICKFPYMVRIVNLNECFLLFSECFFEFAKEGKRLWVEDEILTQNNGIYSFSFVNQEIRVEKQEFTELVKMQSGDKKMNIGEVASFIFHNQTLLKNKVFFAEVI